MKNWLFGKIKPKKKEDRPSQSDATKQALEQLRRTRARIHEDNPELLDRFGQLFQQFEKLNARPPRKRAPKTEDNPLIIDREKNLHTVMKFLETKKHFSPDFQQKLKDVIQETS